MLLKTTYRLLLCLLVAFGIAGCLTDGTDAPTGATSQAIESSTAAEPAAEDVAVAEHEAVAAASCCGPAGCPVPPRVEQPWLSCRITCVNNGGNYHGCKSACCQQYTGCSACYQQ